MASAAKKRPPEPAKAALGEAALISRIFDRCPRPEWAAFSHIRDGAGFDARRTVDALAINTWPSRGLEVHGFECKSSRGDWLREKSDPSKAEAFLPFCDRWWLVVGDEGIVLPGELPPTWGLLVPRGRGLLARVEAPKLEAKPLDRSLLAVILRRAAEPDTNDEQKQALQAARDAGYDAGEKAAKRSAEFDSEREKRRDKMIADFEEASGVSINGWDARRIGAAVKFVLGGGPERERKRLLQLHQAAQEIAAGLERQVAELTAEEQSAGRVA